MKWVGPTFLALMLVTGAYGAENESIASREEIVKATSLETLLGERLKRVVEAAGVHSTEFSATATVHLSKRLRDESEVNRRKNQKPVEPKKTIETDPNDLENSSFGPHSMMSADDLIEQVESKKNDKFFAEVAAAREAAEADPENEPSFDYFVDDIYLQTALSDSVYENAHAQVEKAIHQSFDVLVPGKLKVDIISFSKDGTVWYSQVMSWIAQNPNIVITWVLLSGLALILILFRRFPSVKKEREINQHEHHSPKPEAPSDELEVKEEDKKIDHRELALAQTQKDILTFMASHPYAGEPVVGSWIKDQEPAEKIGYLIEFLAKNGFGVGKIEIRGDQLQELRKRHSEVLDVEKQLEICKQSFWDLISAEHFRQEKKTNPLHFLEFVEDKILLNALTGEPLEVKTSVIGALTDKRAAALISRFPSDEKRKIMESFFSKKTGAELPIETIAENFKEKLQKYSAASETTSSGVETMASILANLDFSSQFMVAQGLLEMPAEARASILRSYFNVALLPVAQDSFLEKVFVDREASFIKSALSQFDPSFIDRVKNVLPAIQQRMLDGTNFESVPRGQAMTTLKELNASILKWLESGEISFEDIFPEKTPENTKEAEPVDSQKVA